MGFLQMWNVISSIITLYGYWKRYITFISLIVIYVMQLQRFHVCFKLFSGIYIQNYFIRNAPKSAEFMHIQSGTLI